MDTATWYQSFEILSISRANLLAMGLSESIIAGLTDVQRHDLALALQSRYMQYAGGFDCLVLRYLSELFPALMQGKNERRSSHEEDHLS